MWWFEDSLGLPFFGAGMKMTFSSPMATGEFSKFAGVLSTALRIILVIIFTASS